MVIDTECGRVCFGGKIERIIEREVEKRLDVRQKQIEQDNKHYRVEMWKARKAESRAIAEAEKAQEGADKQAREAVKTAQREYYFDCAVGDVVYVLSFKFVSFDCDRCDSKRKIKIEVDGVEVDADCPVCGTYSKRWAMEKHEPYIVSGRVERLQIEIVKDKKWIKVWLDNRDNEPGFSAEDGKRVFRTQGEADEALAEIQKKEGGTPDA